MMPPRADQMDLRRYTPRALKAAKAMYEDGTTLRAIAFQVSALEGRVIPDSTISWWARRLNWATDKRPPGARQRSLRAAETKRQRRDRADRAAEILAALPRKCPHCLGVTGHGPGCVGGEPGLHDPLWDAKPRRSA